MTIVKYRQIYTVSFFFIIVQLIPFYLLIFRHMKFNTAAISIKCGYHLMALLYSTRPKEMKSDSVQL